MTLTIFSNYKSLMILGFIFCLANLQSCSFSKELNGDFGSNPTTTAPDYSNPDHWAALPDKKDFADLVPAEQFTDKQEEAKADVFFLHPTTYFGEKKKRYWNGPIDDPKLNLKTDKTPIKFQASLFNAAGKVYAPRYRQANYYVYFTKKKEEAEKAFDFAYQDIKIAFEYYLENYNNGRPIIIAAHSQGTTHAKRLLKEFFDDKPLMKQLVVAYIVGMPITKKEFKNISPCKTDKETGCFCSWRAFQKGYYPEKFEIGDHISVTNPLTWTITDEYAPKTLNQGAVLRKFEKGIVSNLADAQVHQGLLWITKPKFPGSFLITFRNYHIADYNFYYVNVRNNAQTRVASFLKKQSN